MSESINLRAPVSQERHLEILRRENPELESFLAMYPEEEAAKLLQYKDKLSKIAKAFQSISAARSQAAMVMTCRDGCPYQDICILKKEAIAPYGHQCPVEKKIVAELECDVITALGIETNNPIEMELLWDLIDMKLLDMRASAALKDGKLVIRNEMQIAGKMTSFKDEINPIIEAKLDLKRLKHSIIDAFVATRRAKKKYGTNTDQNSIEQLIIQAANRVDKNKDEDE